MLGSEGFGEKFSVSRFSVFHYSGGVLKFQHLPVQVYHFPTAEKYYLHVSWGDCLDGSGRIDLGEKEDELDCANSVRADSRCGPGFSIVSAGTFQCYCGMKDTANENCLAARNVAEFPHSNAKIYSFSGHFIGYHAAEAGVCTGKIYVNPALTKHKTISECAELCNDLGRKWAIQKRRAQNPHSIFYPYSFSPCPFTPCLLVCEW